MVWFGNVTQRAGAKVEEREKANTRICYGCSIHNRSFMKQAWELSRGEDQRSICTQVSMLNWIEGVLWVSIPLHCWVACVWVSRDVGSALCCNIKLRCRNLEASHADQSWATVNLHVYKAGNSLHWTWWVWWGGGMNCRLRESWHIAL
jgi:hypothetical protein